MSDRDALHASICANPDDDTPRLVFADWLDENGESKRAAFIRASIEEFRQATADTSASAVHEFFSSNLIRASVLLDWSEVDLELHQLNTVFRTTGTLHFQPTERSEKLPRIKGVKYDFINRGFFNHIHITNPAQFLKHRKTIFRSTPITSLWFDRLGLDQAKELLGSDDLGQIRELGFGENVSPEAIHVLGNHRDAVGVRKLKMVAGEQGQEQFEALAAGTYWRGVKWFEVSNLDGVDSSAPDLIMSDLLNRPQFQRIQRLHAWGNDLGDLTARAIATGALSELRFLDLERNNIENAGALAIARSKSLPNLRYLDLSSNSLSGEAVSALIATPKLPDLTVLRLDGIPRNHLEIKPLTNTSRGPSLRILQIHGCELTEATLSAMATCPAIHGLWLLSLASCSMGDGELRALTTGTGLEHLKILNLSHNNLTLDGMRTLVQWPATAGMRWLDLSGNKIGDEGAKELVESQYLKNLRHLTVGGSGTTRLRKHFGKIVVQ
jgi:uncharacterized protein (TIGR02996 family)